MSTQKQRHSKARRDRARIKLAIPAKKLVKCSNCKGTIKSHIVCPKCGFYKGKEVVNTLKKVKNKK